MTETGSNSNNSMENITIKDCLIKIEGEIDNQKEIFHEDFLSVMESCKKLKTLKFECHIPLIADTVNDLFSYLNFEFFHMNEIIFECYSIPNWTDLLNYVWIIKKIEFEFERNGDENQKLTVRPIEIEESLREVDEKCSENCILNHFVAKCDSLRYFSSIVEKSCHNYYNSISESFPYLTELVTKCDKTVIIFSLTKLEYLTAFEIRFQTISVEELESIIKVCPRVTKLNLSIDFVDAPITTDNCIEIVSKYLKNIEFLEICCYSKWMTVTGLKFILKNLKELKILKTAFYLKTKDFETLFQNLPKLERITSNYDTNLIISRNNFTNNKVPIENGDACDQFDESWHLPVEILEKIFSYLPRNDQIRCRLICQHWFNICSSSTILDRTLSLSNSLLSSDSEFVSIFKNTTFKYNRMIVNFETHFESQTDLSDFWVNIGRYIKEIVFEGGSGFNFLNAFQTGLIADHFPVLKKMVFDSQVDFTVLLFKRKAQLYLLLERLETLHFGTETLKIVEENQDKTTITPLIEMKNLRELQISSMPRPNFQILHLMVLPKLQKFSILSMNSTKSLLDFDKNFRFELLTELCIGKIGQWGSDVELFLKFKNLRVLTFGFEETSQFKFIDKNSDGTENQYEIEEVTWMLFQKLHYLCKVSYTTFFVSESEDQFYVKHMPLVSFVRTGIKSFERID